MTELSAEIRAQAAEVTRTLREARAAGDDYLVEVSETELSDLARTAEEHGLRIPELDGVRGAA